MTPDERPKPDEEREARARSARRGILLVGLAFYGLLMLMCIVVFVVVFVVAR